MEKYAFKIMGTGGSENEKWIKLFLSSEEVASLRIQVRFPSLKKKAVVNVKYHEGKGLILTLYPRMILIHSLTCSKQPNRKENLKRITLRVNEIAFTPPDVITQLKC